MIKKTFLIFIINLCCSYADEAEDKAEFKRLYAEFNELYANSEDLDPIIEVAEKLYKLAPKIYGKTHQNTAVVTYNLATLYDEKGDSDKPNSPIERKAYSLYKNYFKTLDDLNVNKDKKYLDQFIQYMTSYYHSHIFKADKKLAEEMLVIAHNLNLENKKLANYEYLAAFMTADFVNFDQAIPHFENALGLYQNEFGINHIMVGKLSLILGGNSNSFRNPEKSIERLLIAAKAFEATEEDGDELKIYTYSGLVSKYMIGNDLKAAEYHRKKLQKLDPTKFKPSSVGLPKIRVNPKYPARAAQNGIEGFVVVNFTVDKEGKTKNVIAEDYSDKMFVKSAVTAAKGYKYNPSLENGEAIEVHDVTVRIEFKLANSFGNWRSTLPEKLFNS